MEWTQFVENGLAALTSRQKRTIELIHFEGYTLVEVSLIMGEGLSNIKNHYYRGMRILKEFLKAAERSSSAVETQDGKSMPVEATLPSGLQASPGNCTLS
jgi:hypothetical protein